MHAAGRTSINATALCPAYLLYAIYCMIEVDIFFMKEKKQSDPLCIFVLFCFSGQWRDFCYCSYLSLASDVVLLLARRYRAPKSKSFNKRMAEINIPIELPCTFASYSIVLVPTTSTTHIKLGERNIVVSKLFLVVTCKQQYQ